MKPKMPNNNVVQISLCLQMSPYTKKDNKEEKHMLNTPSKVVCSVLYKNMMYAQHIA